MHKEDNDGVYKDDGYYKEDFCDIYKEDYDMYAYITMLFTI